MQLIPQNQSTNANYHRINNIGYYKNKHHKPSNHNKIDLLKELNNQIKQEYHKMHRKIINMKNNEKNQKYYKLYKSMNYEQDKPIEINSQIGNNNIKCIIPPPISNYKRKGNQKNKSKFNYQKKSKSYQSEIIRQNKNLMKQQKESTIIHYSTSQIKGKQQQNPQNMLSKVILYKKTEIISPMISCLIEISLVKKRLLFMAYVMGGENYTSRLYLDAIRSYQILSTFKNDYNLMGSKVSIDDRKQINIQQLIQMSNYKYVTQVPNVQKIKITTKNQQYKIQQDFLKRNYMIKKNSYLQSKQTDQTINNKKRYSFTQKDIQVKISTFRKSNFLKRYKVNLLNYNNQISNINQNKQKSIKIKSNRSQTINKNNKQLIKKCNQSNEEIENDKNNEQYEIDFQNDQNKSKNQQIYSINNFEKINDSQIKQKGKLSNQQQSQHYQFQEQMQNRGLNNDQYQQKVQQNGKIESQHYSEDQNVQDQIQLQNNQSKN